LELGTGAGGVKKLEWWGYRVQKEAWRYLQPFEYNPPTWQTDRQTDIGRQKMPHLHMAARGKNEENNGIQLLSCQKVQ